MSSLLSGMIGLSLAAPGDEGWDFRFGRPALDGEAIAAVWHEGQLHVGGGFRIAGNAAASSVARWDGTNWWPLGAGLADTCDRIFSQGTNLLALGSFTRSGDVLLDKTARWNGSNWSPVGTNIWRASSGEQAYALARNPEGELFVGDAFTHAGG